MWKIDSREKERKKPGLEELKKQAILHCAVEWAGIFFDMKKETEVFPGWLN